MNKLLQTTLVSAIMATSGFATGDMLMLKDGGEVQTGCVIDFQGQSVTLSEGKSLDVYGSLTGTGSINCSGNGKVNIYAETYKKNDDLMEPIKSAVGIDSIKFVHTVDDSKKGHIDDTIKINPSEALIITGADLANYASKLSNTDLIYIANSTGQTTLCIGGDESVTEISSALANTPMAIEIEGLTPTGLIIKNKLKFTGDNSGFYQKTVTIGSLEKPADVEYTSAKSVFLTETTVEAGSKLAISSTDEIRLTKDLTINGVSKLQSGTGQEAFAPVSMGNLIINGKLILTSGVTLKLGTDFLTKSYENPTEMVWADGSFSNELTGIYNLYHSDKGDIMFWKNGNTWESSNNSITITESADQLTFTDEGIEFAIPLADLSIDTSKEYTESNKKYYTDGTENFEVYLIEAHDGIFSYSYDADNKSWVRVAQNLVVPAGLDLSTITKSDSTWLVLNGGENIYTISPSKEADTLVINMSSSSDNTLGSGDGPANLGCIYLNDNFNYIDKYFYQGNIETGYWYNNNTSDEESDGFDGIIALSKAIKSGETWKTLKQYNTDNGTSYTW